MDEFLRDRTNFENMVEHDEKTTLSDDPYTFLDASSSGGHRGPDALGGDEFM